MGNIETFTLNPKYENFVPGKTRLEPFLPYMSQTLLLIFSLGMTIFSFMGAFGSVRHMHERILESQDAPLLETTGQEVLAHITDCSTISVRYKGKFPVVTYRYIWENVSYTRTETIRQGSIYPCKSYVGGGIAILLLPENPSRAYIVGNVPPQPLSGSDVGNFILVLVFSVIFGISSSFIIIYIIYFSVLNRRLRHTRTLIEGEIISIKSEWELVSRKTNTKEFYITLHYQFETPRKRVLTGHGRFARPDLKDKPLPPIGTPVTILYADNRTHMVL